MRLSRTLAAGLIVAMIFAESVVAAEERVVVGIRSNARPFVYEDPGVELGFGGFIFDICEAALSRAGYEGNQVIRVSVDALSRWQLLMKPHEEGGIDILCDTTSVTPERAAHFLFSPMIFLAGVSYAFSPTAESTQHGVFVAANRGDTAAQVSPISHEMAAPYCADAPDGLHPRLSSEDIPLVRIGVVEGTSAVDAVRSREVLELLRVRPDLGEKVCIAPIIGGYASGAERLCEGDIAYFFGDRDMVLFYVQAYQRENLSCDAVVSGRFFSFEPYAMTIRTDRPALLIRIQAALYSLFRDATAIDLIWRKHFGERRRSSLLEALYRINAIGRL